MLSNILIIVSIILVIFTKYFAIIPLIILLAINLSKMKKTETIHEDIYKGIFVNELNKANEQDRQFKTKRKIIEDILSNEFGGASVTYRKFLGTVCNVERVFSKNIEAIFDKINKIDESKVLSNKNTESLDDIYRIFSENEKILKSLNDLIIELGKLDDTKDLKNLCSLEELELLIKDTKKYRRE